MKLLLLPGMDGTGLLFRRFVEALPSHIEPIVHAYDTQRAEDYDTLFATLPDLDEPYAILGESFSGPLAIQRTARDKNVRAIILASSFERAPRPALALLSMLGRTAFSLTLPRVVARQALLGSQATEDLIDELWNAVAQVRGEVIAHRLQQIAKVDVSTELASLRCPRAQTCVSLHLPSQSERNVDPSSDVHLAQGTRWNLATPRRLRADATWDVAGSRFVPVGFRRFARGRFDRIRHGPARRDSVGGVGRARLHQASPDRGPAWAHPPAVVRGMHDSVA